MKPSIGVPSSGHAQPHDAQTNNRPCRVGLLFVHGIGEQQRFEFLTNSVREFAELMKSTERHAVVNVVDRTADWKFPPGHPDIRSEAPITLSYRAPGAAQIQFECHEVWWADLGARAGVFESVWFWVWALGQWSAPIYKDLNAARVRQKVATTGGVDATASSASKAHKGEQDIATMPTSVAGTVAEVIVRAQLMLAALAALFTAATWTLAKKVSSKLFGTAPSPTLLVQYLGDVRTYEARASPNNSVLSDPGFPQRVAIRRRMVAEMVAMADRGYDGWWIVAHSLGSVVAYNGITEIGHTLPNYLPRKLWESLGASMKHDDGVERRRNLAAMMPARPDWLVKEDVINRRKLFEKLRGMVTFGSPLEKFAALWPRILATATDRRRLDETLFPDTCRWINLAAPHDPIAGRLASFGHDGTLGGHLPKLESYRTFLWWDFILAHITYFKGAERFNESKPIRQKRAVMSLLVEKKDPGPEDGLADSGISRWVPRMVLGVYCAITVVLGLLTTLLVVVGGGLAKLVGIDTAGKTAGLGEEVSHFMHSPFTMIWSVFSAALAILLVAGLWRWLYEVTLNLKLARYDCRQLQHEQAATKDLEQKKLIGEDLIKAERVVALFCSQRRSSVTVTGIAIVLVILAGVLTGASGMPSFVRPLVLFLTLAAIAYVAMTQQTLINARANTDPVSTAPDESSMAAPPATGAAPHESSGRGDASWQARDVAELRED